MEKWKPNEIWFWMQERPADNLPPRDAAAADSVDPLRIIPDPMLATGGSASSAASILRERGAEDLRMLCVVAAPEGVRRMLEDHPDVMIYAAVLDERLDERGYIRPGLGDAGDRLFGTGAWTNTIEIP